MIYKRGEIYHFKFKVGGAVHQGTLKTSDPETAKQRHDHIRATTKAMALSTFSLVDISVQNEQEWAGVTTDQLEGMASDMAAGMRHRAKKKGIRCEMGKADVLRLLVECGGVCSVTGIPLSLKSEVEGCRGSPWVPSIDRINSGKGYTAGNCRIVCYLANLAMSQFGVAALELMLHYYAATKMPKPSSHISLARRGTP